jgi:hypothetical protein
VRAVCRLQACKALHNALLCHVLSTTHVCAHRGAALVQVGWTMRLASMLFAELAQLGSQCCSGTGGLPFTPSEAVIIPFHSHLWFCSRSFFLSRFFWLALFPNSSSGDGALRGGGAYAGAAGATCWMRLPTTAPGMGFLATGGGGMLRGGGAVC